MPEETCERLARQLARWREVRNVICSRLNHDLRAPLTAIVGFADLLGDEPLTPEQQGYVQRILNAADKINAILDEVQRALSEAEQEM